MKLTQLAIDNIELDSGYDHVKVQRAWLREDYGTLHSYDTGKELRTATAKEALASYEANPLGLVSIDGVDVYVVP